MPQKHRHKKRSGSKAYLFLLLLLLVAAGVFFLWTRAQNKPGTITPTANPEVTLDPSATDDYSQYADVDETDEDGTYKVVAPEDQVAVTDLSVTEGLDEAWRNILLIGQDTRSSTVMGRSDTMIILSVNTDTGAVKLCSLLRDTWLDIPGVGEERANVAHQYGGPQLTIKMINETFGLNIKEYASVNFATFPFIIEAIGGVEINVKSEEVPYINAGVGNSIWEGKINNLDETLLDDSFLPEDASGKLLLTGRQALAYARIRKLDSDFKRTARQRTVITAVMNKFKGADANELLALATQVVPYVTSNVDVMTMVSLAVPVLRSGLKDMSEMRMPIDESYTEESRDFIYAFYDVDVEANKAALHQFIYGE